MNWGEILGKALRAGLTSALRTTQSSRRSSRPAQSVQSAQPAQSAQRDRDSTPSRQPSGRTGAARRYPGDFTGRGQISYHPREDGRPDPGEIVWAWVPYEEDHSRGKDRPTLVIGIDKTWLLALMLTSKDHDVDQAAEARAGRHWVDIGTGDWDARRRPSEVRVDRVLRLDPAGVRREGGRLDRERFDLVAVEVRRVNGW